MKYGAIKYGTAYRYGKNANATGSVAVSDSRLSSASKAANDSVTVSDIAQAVIIFALFLLEFFTVSDRRNADTSKGVSDSGSVSDSASKQASAVRSDSFSVSDSVSRAVGFVRELFDTATIRDSWLAYLNGMREWLWQKLSKTVGNWINSPKSSGDDWQNTPKP